MFRIEYLKPSEAWRPDTETIASFRNGHRVCRIHGPARLVRLLSHAGQAPEGQFYEPNRQEGSFWFAESDFLKLKSEAETELRRQAVQKPFQSPFQSLVGQYMRQQLRDLLAVRRDWTPSFDYFTVLDIPVQASVIALVGTIKAQPVYSKGISGADSARAAGIVLAGGLTQYVVDFRFPANAPFAAKLSPPRGF